MTSQCRGRSLSALIVCLFASLIHAQAPKREAKQPKPPAVKKADSEEAKIPVTHQDEEDGWNVAETTNFRLFHQHPRSVAEAVLRKAEQTRTTQLQKWFKDDADWDAKCRIIFYPSGEAYGAATGAPVHPAGGHTDITGDEGRVLRRCIHLHGAKTFLLRGVLPHEVTHAVLAGRLNTQRVPPRWADEGMAILAESQAHIDQHYRQLPRWRADEALFDMRELIQMRDYPPPRSIGVFYAQSVSLVDFLTKEKGSRRFTSFVRDGERDGYAASLRKHYGWTFDELDRRWQKHVFAQGLRREQTQASE
jgi:hypothetical protein